MFELSVIHVHYRLGAKRRLESARSPQLIVVLQVVNTSVMVTVDCGRYS